DRLVEDGRAQVYLTDDGMQAVRLNAAAPVEVGARVPPRSPAVPVALVSDDPAAHDASCLEEIRRAQAAMPGGYIGAHFFVTRWKSGRLPEVPDLRRRTLDRLVEQGKVEIVLTEDGVQAVRLRE
ncbi:MAG: hypothetical protein K8T20_17160, partial [Planctomycetes bacterium]|nr:hypothetical protein [Planctomycetota bacterium]